MRYDTFRAQGYLMVADPWKAGARMLSISIYPGRGRKQDNTQAMLAGLSELHNGRFAWAWQQIHQPTA